MTTHPSTPNTHDLDGTIFISDNLPFLKALDTESVDLVCIDPPFAKNETFTGRLRPPLSKDEQRIERALMDEWGVFDEESAYAAGIEYPDQDGATAKFRDIFRFDRDVYEDWMLNIGEQNPGLAMHIESTRYTHSDTTAAYIAFMAERMLQIRRILKPTGSVYLHCDHTANAYLRQLMDAVFGHNNFRNEIIWERAFGGKASQYQPRQWGSNSDTILFYAKSDRVRVAPYRRLSEAERDKEFPKTDDDGRRYNERGELYRRPSQGARPNLCYEFMGFHNRGPEGWRLSRKRMQEEYDKSNVVIENGRIIRRIYEDQHKGSPLGSVWTDIPFLGGSTRERTGYPTQKPQALARRIIEASTNPGDVVLDCFAGCAYVPVAAQLTGRRWIACDMSPRAWTVIRRQFHKHPDLGIITEGEIAADANGLEAEVKLETANRVIRVRGPHQLPTPTDAAERDAAPAPARLPRPRYRVRPHETDAEIWNAFVDQYGTTCWYCGAEKMNDRRELQLDHVEPNAHDGTNDDCWNRALACVACNSDKRHTLSPTQTIAAAHAAGRIATPARMREIKETFASRRRWAKERWQRIRPNKAQ